jgi:hypothetical protein
MGDVLNVLCWFWKQPGGRAEYLPMHVNIWADMVSRNLSIPHRISCVTDHPEGIDPHINIIKPPGDFEDVTLPTWGVDKPQCLRRISLFRPDAADIFGERFVSMDIDCVISGDITDLFTGGEDFRMFRGTAPQRPYNGSMLMMRAGSRPQVYTRFTPRAAIAAGKKFIGSDQAWISHVLGWGQPTWGEEHGVTGYHRNARRRQFTRLMFTFGSPKPWDLVDLEDKHCIEHFRIKGRGAAVYLDGGPTVWADFRALQDDFGMVIASEEVAEHFPGGFFQRVTNDKAEAKKLARMMGYDTLIHCGQIVEELEAA